MSVCAVAGRPGLASGGFLSLLPRKQTSATTPGRVLERRAAARFREARQKRIPSSRPPPPPGSPLPPVGPETWGHAALTRAAWRAGTSGPLPGLCGGPLPKYENLLYWAFVALAPPTPHPGQAPLASWKLRLP